MSDTNDPQQGAREGTRPDAPNNVDSKVEPQGAAEANRPGTPDNLGSELEQRDALEPTRSHARGTVPSKVEQEGARSEALDHVHELGASHVIRSTRTYSPTTVVELNGCEMSETESNALRAA